MGTLHKTGRFTIRVNGSEHPPVHSHVNSPDGRAMVYRDGKVKNSGVDDRTLAEACAWIPAHHQAVIDEWNTCNPTA